MNKLYLISVALLCLFCMSCSQSETEELDTLSYELESRSVSPLTISYKTAAGIQKSENGDRVGISYLNTNKASITILSGEESLNTEGANIQVISANGQLSVTLDGGTTLEVDDILIDPCGVTLCYEDSGLILSGTALEFIVEDLDSGF